MWGRCAEQTDELRSRVRTIGNRINRAMHADVVVPLDAIGYISPWVDADRDMVKTLCQVLSDRPELLPRLADRTRMERLATEIVSEPHNDLALHIGVRRRSVEIITAMRLLGLQHRYGSRPLPDDPIPPLEELVSRVLARVQANPYAEGVPVNEDSVREVVEREYAGIKPWPIAALTD